MPRPPRVERLRHGRLLSGKPFAFFVETWNWLSRAFDNLKGDADTNGQNGHIHVDWTDSDSPVIRLVNLQNLLAGGGGGGGESITASGTIAISVDYVTSSGDSDFAAHPYAIRIRRGTLTYNAGTGALSVVEDNNLKQFIDTIEHSAAMDQT